MILDWVSTMGVVWPSMTPEQVLAMDALYSVELCAAFVRRRRASAGNAAAADEGWRDMPDGSKVRRITSMDGMRSVLASGPPK